MLMTIGEKNSVLNDIDAKILEEVRLDARISYRDLAEKVDLSANAVADRMFWRGASGSLVPVHSRRACARQCTNVSQNVPYLRDFGLAGQDVVLR